MLVFGENTNLEGMGLVPFTVPEKHQKDKDVIDFKQSLAAYLTNLTTLGSLLSDLES